MLLLVLVEDDVEVAVNAVVVDELVVLDELEEELLLVEVEVDDELEDDVELLVDELLEVDVDVVVVFCVITKFPLPVNL